MVDLSLAGKRALVTGAGRGIGREIALTLARAGAHVAIVSRTEAEVLALAGEIESKGGSAFPAVVDVSDERAVANLSKMLSNEWGYLDVVVNNAAVFSRRAVADLSLADWNAVIGTNLTGAFLVARETLPLLRKTKGGAIVFISSTAGKRGYADGAAYSASKHGVMGLAHALLYEVRGDDIRVVVVSPSAVETRKSGKSGGAREGKGVKLHASDVALTVLFACALPGRALVRDVELWGTNP